MAKKKTTNQPENNIILYQDENGLTRVDVRFAHEDVWLNQEQLAEIYCTTQQNVSLHIRYIYADGELSQEATHKKFLLVRREGSRQVNRDIDHYNLDVIAEFQALEQNAMSMADWVAALDNQIIALRRKVLEGSGTISHEQAMEKAEQEFRIYREREMKQLESDFDKAIRQLSFFNQSES